MNEEQQESSYACYDSHNSQQNISIRSTKQLKNVMRQSATKRKLLIVDDVEFNIDILKILIKKINSKIQVDHALSGKDGISLVEQNLTQRVNLYFVILLDIEMPDMNGFDACYQMIDLFNENEAFIPIFGCSGYNDPETIQKCKKLGMKGFLQKPIQMQELDSLL